MSAGTVRLLIVGALMVRGIGHTLGLMPAFGLATSNTWTSRS